MRPNIHFIPRLRRLSFALRFLLFVFLRPVLLAQGSASLSQTEREIQEIHAQLERHEANGLNGVILIRRGSDTLLHRAYGERDREAAERLAVEHGFDIGSIVKPITAVAILKLEESGRLSIDDTLGQHFSGIPADKRLISIRQLLTHTAGLPDVFGPDSQVVTRDWVLDQLFRAPLIAKPGEAEIYSNVGYSLLAALVEMRSGQSFERYVRDAVLAPASVTNIGYRLAGWTSAQLAVTYGLGGLRHGTALDQPWADDGPSWNLRGNGGMLGTAQALSQWFQALFDGRILGSEALTTSNAVFVRPSRITGTPSFGFAGGNDVFNALQVNYINEDAHLTFFTSDVRFQAELLWPELRDLFMRAIRRQPGAR